MRRPRTRPLILAATLGAIGAATVAGGALAADPAWLRVKRLAGEASRPASGPEAFMLPIRSLSRTALERFFRGRTLFDISWVPAPSPVTELDGLGPTFNRVSCGGCHIRNGRGDLPPRAGEPVLTATVRVSTANGRDHPDYGRQINTRAIDGVPPEARVSIVWTIVRGRYGDGTPYELRRPAPRLSAFRFGPLDPTTRLSLRIAQPIVGLGLLSHVDPAEILKAADPQDRDGNGISGRAHWVTDPRSGRRVLGRFGWKATEPDLEAQNARAALTDIGLTTRHFAAENCPPVQKRCGAKPSGGRPEISDGDLRALTFYSAALAVPERRRVTDASVMRGGRLFVSFGCTACHRPALSTNRSDAPEWARGLTLYAFTDLLLHDMGPGLADNFRDGDASGREWRTPPLWGIGLTRIVSGREAYLHDGRARTLAEAVLWHGGEAKPASEAFRRAPKADRDDLIEFLKSL